MLFITETKQTNHNATRMKTYRKTADARYEILVLNIFHFAEQFKSELNVVIKAHKITCFCLEKIEDNKFSVCNVLCEFMRTRQNCCYYTDMDVTVMKVYKSTSDTFDI